MSFPDTTHSPFFKEGIIGPWFKGNTCFVCHFMDGKGYPEDMFGSDPNINTLSFCNLQVHDSITGAPMDHPVFGPALQTKAMPPYQPQGKLNVAWDSVSGQYADGTPFMLRKPRYSFSNLAYGVTSIDLNKVSISPRYTPHLSGLGLLEAVDESTILSFINMPGKAGTGISGHPNRVNDPVSGNPNALGRFGWKAGLATLKHELFACIAFDLGISNRYFKNQPPPGAVADPEELSEAVMDTLVGYISLLAPPPRQMGKGYIVYDPKIVNATSGGHIWADPAIYKGETWEEIWRDPSAIRGKDLFVQAKCDLCHIPAIRTGTSTNFEELKNIEIQPFTDMLLHNMGPEDGDNGYEEGYAAGPNDWRTPPLWGMNYIKYSNKVNLFMHDGRARNLAEAILWHFGEGTISRNAFINMSATDRADLIRYCEYPFADRLPKKVKAVVGIARDPQALIKFSAAPALSCYPNPIRNMASIRLENITVGKGDRIIVSIYNVQGRRVFSEIVRPGQNVVQWNTVKSATGKYIAHLIANGKMYKKTLLVMR
jgi:CxxC motif-containing protein (DUF1111 family)